MTVVAGRCTDLSQVANGTKYVLNSLIVLNINSFRSAGLLNTPPAAAANASDQRLAGL